MMISISENVLRKCIEALKYKAHMEAGRSQEPNLFDKEDTEEWETAELITATMRSQKARAKAAQASNERLGKLL